MEWLHPWALLLLPLPLLMKRLRPSRSGDALVVPERLAQWLELLQGASHWRGRMAGAGMLAGSIGWCALVLALATPLTGRTPLPDATGRDLMIALDLSVSMLTRDVMLDDRPVPRIEAVKSLAGAFIQRRDGDRVGLIAFADQPFLIAPPTYDVAEVSVYLDEIDVGLPGRKTAVGDAIGMAVLQLRKQPPGTRVLLLLTDGSSNSGSIAPDQAARLALDNGVRIYTIGFGAGDDDTGTHGTPLADLAQTTGGRHFAARSTGALQEVYREIDRIEPVASSEVPRYSQRDWTHELTLLATLMLLAALLSRWAERRTGVSAPS